MTTLRKLVIADLHKLQETARQQAWELKKAGFPVDFFYRFHKRGYSCLTNSELYDYEKIVVYELIDGECNKIIDDIDYFSLSNFYNEVKHTIKRYGKKQLHQHTKEILNNYDIKINIL